MEGRGLAHDSHRSAHGPPDVALGAIEHPRSIRSFVMRGGRITEAQQRALDSLWPRYGIAFQPAPLDVDAAFGRRAPLPVDKANVALPVAVGLLFDSYLGAGKALAVLRPAAEQLVGRLVQLGRGAGRALVGMIR